MLRTVPLLAILSISVTIVSGDDAGGGGSPPSFEIAREFDDAYSLETTCDRLESRVVRKIINTELLPIVEHAGMELSRDCPLHPENDRLADHENHKKFVRSTGWRCKYCNKMFKSEKWIDVHLGARHSDTLLPSRTVCLGRFCGLFRCRSDPLFSSPGKGARSEERRERDRRSKERREGLERHSKGERCDPAEMDRLRFLCLATVQRCVPEVGGSKGHGSSSEEEEAGSESGSEAGSSDSSSSRSTLLSEAIGAEDRAELVDALNAKFCLSLTCDSKEREENARRAEVHPKVVRSMNKSSAKSKLYYIGVGFVVAVLVIFYIGVWVYKRDISVQSDLRRLDGKRRGDALMFWRRKKEKGY